MNTVMFTDFPQKVRTITKPVLFRSTTTSVTFVPRSMKSHSYAQKRYVGIHRQDSLWKLYLPLFMSMTSNSAEDMKPRMSDERCTAAIWTSRNSAMNTEFYGSRRAP
jgi:hypothetical protein